VTESCQCIVFVLSCALHFKKEAPKFNKIILELRLGDQDHLQMFSSFGSLYPLSNFPLSSKKLLTLISSSAIFTSKKFAALKIMFSGYKIPYYMFTAALFKKESYNSPPRVRSGKVILRIYILHHFR
jgi:hypothetical protein